MANTETTEATETVTTPEDATNNVALEVVVPPNTNTKKYTIVLASYSEAIDWLKFVPAIREDYEIVVYNSSGKDYPLADRTVQRDNFGREAGHYLQYLVDNYNNLAETVVFLQASPWVHINGDNMTHELLSLFYGTPSFPEPICYLGAQYGTSTFFNLDDAPEIRDTLLPYYSNGDKPEWVQFSIGAQFYVQREVIQRMPLAYYEDLLSLVRANVRNVSYAHVLEGKWGFVFYHNKTA
jgi:hypothetical protein